MDIEKARFNMVEQQIRPCDISDKALLDVLLNIKRENFVLPEYKNIAFADVEIPLPSGVKMLCPRIDAILLQALALNKNDKVLEVGTGSGYVTAMLGKLSEFVYSVEIDEKNRQFAIRNLTYAGINNVNIVACNGLLGLESTGPYNKIFIGGAVTHVPDALKEQLIVGGILVAIIGDENVMHAIKITKISDSEYTEAKLNETIAEFLQTDSIKQFNF